MATYRFIGTLCEIGGQTQLDHFGQQIELDETVAKTAILGGAGLVTEAQFADGKFTAEEQTRYANPGARNTAPEEFRQRQRLVEKHRDSLVTYLRGGGESLEDFVKAEAT